jgi:nucleoside-diphosphate-sugar epimerase
MRPSILLTGATGFIGGALAARLLREDADVTVHVRAPSVDAARDRLHRSVARFLEAAEARALASRFSICLGDLAEPGTYSESAARWNEMTHIVHAAACTSFRAAREAYRTNVQGTALLAERAQRMPSLQRFLYVSTAYVCGPEAPIHVRECPANPDLSHVAHYTRSKAMAESLLEPLAGGLRLLIVRPSIVVGHTQLGCQPSASLFWYYRTLAQLGRAPFGSDDRRDVVPVDWVADALLHLTMRDRVLAPIVHLSAGAPRACRWGDIRAAFALRGLSPPTGECAERVPIAALARPLSVLTERLQVRAPERFERALCACARFSTTAPQFFDDAAARAEHVTPAPPFTSYIARCIESVAHRDLESLLEDDV